MNNYFKRANYQVSRASLIFHHLAPSSISHHLAPFRTISHQTVQDEADGADGEDGGQSTDKTSHALRPQWVAFKRGQLWAQVALSWIQLTGAQVGAN